MFGLFKKSYEQLRSTEFEQRVSADKNGVVLDVRTAAEFKNGHLPHAVNADIMSSQFADKVAKLDKTKTYYVYCQAGSRSGQACNYMAKQGLTAVNLAGGIMSWSGKVVR